MTSIVNVGAFVVDLQERRIYNAQNEIAAEPKVVEILCYLILNRERFVSLTELHENVWAGRVVTDTAVRRTISKLRALLNDTDANNPRYIKSQMKRGYQFVCPVQESATLPDTVGVYPTANIYAGEDCDKSITKPTRLRIKHLLAVLALPLILVVIYLFINSSIAEPSVRFEQNILAIPGQKASLTVSKDGKLQAFVGKVDNSSAWELFLYDSSTGQLKKLSTPTKHSRFVSFIDNDTKLAYVGYDDGVSKLYTQPLANLEQPAILHPTERFPLLADPIGLAQDKILIAASNNASDNFHYYEFDLKNNSFEQFTFGGNDYVQDAFARISPDHTMLALGRANLTMKNVKLQIYRLADRELIAEYPLHDSLKDFRLAWVNSNTLFIRSAESHKLIDIGTGKTTSIKAEPYPMRDFSFTEQGELYALTYRLTPRNVYQAAWPLNQGFSRSFQLGNNVTALHYSNDEDYLWLLEFDQNLYRLSRYYPRSNDKQLVMESSEEFNILDQNFDSSLLLLKRDLRLELLNTVTAESTLVTVSTQDVNSGWFNQAENEILFAERNKGKWQIKRYSLLSKTQFEYAQNYVYLAEVENGFIAADETGNVWRLDGQLQRIVKLYEGLLYDLDFKFELQGNHLVIVFRTLMGDWKLVDINASDYTVWQRTMPFYDMSTKFSLDKTGTNVIFLTVKKEENQLVKYGYNFGYN